MSDDELELAVVGAGLAGLRCAVEAGIERAAVFERDARPGGRVHSQRRGPWVWERGASFAYNPMLAPDASESSDIELETGPIILEDRGQLHVDPNIRGCLLAGFDGSERERLAAQLASFADHRVELDALDPRLRARLTASFAVLHPGPLADYGPGRQRDALLRFANRWRRAGNSELVTALRERLPCPLWLEREVVALSEEDDEVTLSWRDRAGQVGTTRAKLVVLAVPAPIAGALLPPRCPVELRERLRSWPTRGGQVVTLGLRGAALPDFSYLVSTRPTLAAIVQRRGPDPARRSLSLYFIDDPAGSPEVELDACLELLAELGLGELGTERVELFDRHRWPMIGAIIGQAYDPWDPELLRPTPRIRLAGDWTHLSDGKGMPYGMVAASESGRRAAAEVRAELDARPAKLDDERSFGPLASSTMLALEASGPRYLGRIDDGDVAYWGLIACAEPSPALTRYLWSASKDGLWEYHRGYGTSAADSAFVIEGLLRTGEDRERLRVSLDRLVARYHDRDSGGFLTVLHPRAAYWAGPSADTTAQILWLLTELAPERRELIAGALGYVLDAQADDGLWPSRWYPSRSLATFLATRAVAAAACVLDRRVVAELGRARLGLVQVQRDDGSWEGSVIDTSAALLTLADPQTGACARGLAWLESRKRDQAEGPAWPGEPILSYWFELPSGERRMYFTVDHGRITSAWATLALRALAD